ncbi:hypothetical protein ACWF94_39835 [Streptomyces sp. NPDC055078]
MTKLLLSVHVLASILTVGPVTVAASLFPRYVRAAAAGGETAGGETAVGDAETGDGETVAAETVDGEETGDRAAGIAAMLHRICRGYAIAGLAVPMFGFATGAKLGVLTDAWLIVSVVLTAVAAGVLALAILPRQESLLERMPVGGTEGEDRPVAARLSALTGVFNLLWAVVVVLMIVRPGSTTGA